MKKLVKIALILSILIVLFVIDIPYILSVFSLDEKLKNYIVNNINTETEKVVSIEDMKIGFWTIEANDIKIISSTKASQFVIKNIKFNYNILQLITDTSQPQNAINEIVLREPKLILKQSSIKDSNYNSSLDQINDSLKINYINKISNFTGINKVQLQDAKIIFKKDSGELLVLADKLNGWLNSNDNANITISAEGSIFYGIDNFKLFFDVNLKQENILGRIELVNYDVNNSRFLINNSDLIVDHGNLDGRIYVSSNEFNIDSLKFNGYLNISGLNGNYQSARIDDFNANLFAENNDISLKKCNGLFNNSKFYINATLKNLFNPEISIQLNSPDFYLSSLKSYVINEGFNGSKVNLNCTFGISSEDTTGCLRISSPTMQYKNETMKNLSFNVDYENNALKIRKLNLDYLDFNLTTSGMLNIDNGDLSYCVYAARKFGSHIIFDQLSEKLQEANLKVNGNIFNKTMKGLWTYLVSDSTDTLYNFDGIISLDNELFTFTKHSVHQNDFLFTFQLSDIFSSPQINYGYVENIPFQRLSSRNWIKSIFKQFEFEGILVGSLKSLNSEVKLFSKNAPDKELILTVNIENILEKEKHIAGSWEINNFKGIVNLKLGEDFLTGNIKSANHIYGEIDLNLTREKQLAANINLDNFDLGIFFNDSTSGEYGQLTGLIEANGSLDNPVVEARLTGDRFVLNDIGYYKFDTQLSLENSFLDLSEIKISLNNSPILLGKVNLSLKSDSIFAQAYGNNVDADYIFRTIFNDDYKLNGLADYNFQISGAYKSPNLSSSIDFKEGDIDEIPYDKMHIELRDSIIDNTQFKDYKNHLINIENFSLIKNGQYHFESEGSFPLYADGNIDLDMKFTGDIFSLIPHWSSFIVDGASFTNIDVKLAGTPEKLKVEKGVAVIERGELWLGSVAEHIDDLNGKIEILPKTNKVNFINLTADINGNELVINTEHDVSLSNGVKLQPWYFKGIDLDFGVLTLATSMNGIEINIPGLMIEGEKGFLSLNGKEEDEKFYFAGPVRNPVARGLVSVSKSRLTYPFPQNKSKEKDQTEEFLENINWDLLVFAGKDLIYERNIDAFLDEVYTELYVNPGGKGLEFTGTINRNTFKANGNLISERGRLDYLDLNFRVESFGVEFNEQNQEPRVFGRAWTVVRDSVGSIPKTIYLELYAVDPETGQEIQSASWEDFRFRLVSADPTIGETQEQVLSYLGYSVENIQNKATEVGGAVTENYLIRPLLRPIERSLEKYLGFDLVRFNSNIAKNLFHVSLGNVPGFNNSKSYLYNLNSGSPYLFLFESSEVTVGKYLSPDLYLTYTGQLVATAVNQSNEFNFNHSIGVEYRFLKNILLEFEYDREMLNYFSTFTDKPYYDDFKIRLRHSFSF